MWRRRPTRCELLVATLVAAGVAGAACGPPPAQPTTVERPPALISPEPVDPAARGAALLTELAAQLQPEWAQFLEDCRTRLPAAHPLNRTTLAATAELAIGRSGLVRLVALAGSGDADFDRAVRGVVKATRSVDPPSEDLISDDDEVHVRWLFARDRRQAGPATAELLTVEQPLAEVTARRIADGHLDRAIARVARAPATDPAREAATEHVMIEVLREAAGEAQGPASRRVAVEAIGQARIAELAPDVRRLLSPLTATELRLAAIATAAALGDRAAVPDLLDALPGDLAGDPRLAFAEATALVQLGAEPAAALAVRRSLEKSPPPPAALGALAAVAIPSLDGKLATWFARGDARVRAAVCTGITRPAAQPVAVRGLRDPDATVRAACLDAIGRLGPSRASAAVVARLRELARDRDRTVRARAVLALSAVQAGPVAAAVDDPAPEVRASAARTASDAQLAALINDPEPDVRAAALTELGVRLQPLVTRALDPDAAVRAQALAALGDKHLAVISSASTDPASQVRRAAVPSIFDEPTLVRLAADDAPEVASDAQIALVQRRGRVASTTPSLARLIVGASERERIRIALAWLLAPAPRP